MKRLVIILASLFALSGIAYAGSGPSGPEQYSWPQEKKIIVEHKDDGWSVGDYIAVVGTSITAVGVLAGIYLQRRKKQ